MGTWNYRILFDGRDFWVGEVYYDNDRPVGYTSPSKDTLAWDNIADLRGTIDHVAQAKTSPVLRVDPDTESFVGEMTEAELSAVTPS